MSLLQCYNERRIRNIIQGVYERGGLAVGAT